MTKKQIVILVIMVIVIIAGGILGYLNLKGDKEKDNNLNRVEVVSKSNMSNFDGYWYETKDKAGLNYVKVSSNSGQSVDLVLSFYDLHTFANLTITLEDNAGNISISEGSDFFKGTISFYDNELILYVSESTYIGIELGTTYTFSYHTEKEQEYVEPETGEDVDLEYKGTWYTGIKGDFKDNLVISSIQGNKINAKLTLGKHVFMDTKISISNNVGNFELTDNTGTIEGEIELTDIEIIVRISSSTISDLTADNYTFDFKSKTVTYKDYMDQWYMEEKVDENNYIEIRDYSRNTVVFDLLIFPYANLKNVAVDMNNNFGSFQCKSSADEREINGNIVLDDDRIYIVITNSTVNGVENGTVYEYMYKGGDLNGEES